MEAFSVPEVGRLQGHFIISCKPGENSIKSMAQTSGAVFADELKGHVHDELAVAFADAAEKIAQALEITRGITVAAPFLAVGLDAFRERRRLGWLFALVEKLVERNFEGAGQFFESLNGGNSVAVLDAGNVATLEAGALLDVTLREVLLLPHGA